MRIALDVESVLAEPNEPALAATDRLDRERVESVWDMDSYTYQVYMGVTDAIWRHKPDVIEPEEPHVARHVNSLRPQHEIHILTGRQHVDEQVQWWLDTHGVQYDSFESTGRSKCTYDEFDVFIDDNPKMVGDCGPLLLRDQPWNEHIDCAAHDDVTRIRSLNAVSMHL